MGAGQIPFLRFSQTTTESPKRETFANDDCDVNVIMARGTSTVDTTLGDSVFVAVLKQYCACKLPNRQRLPAEQK
jgi:hypothetical protein